MRNLKEIRTALKIVNDLENKIQDAVKKGHKTLFFGFKLEEIEGINAMWSNVTQGVIEELKNAEYDYTVIASEGVDTVRIDINL